MHPIWDVCKAHSTTLKGVANLCRTVFYILTLLGPICHKHFFSRAKLDVTHSCLHSILQPVFFSTPKQPLALLVSEEKMLKRSSFGILYFKMASSCFLSYVGTDMGLGGG